VLATDQIPAELIQTGDKRWCSESYKLIHILFGIWNNWNRIGRNLLLYLFISGNKTSSSNY